MKVCASTMDLSNRNEICLELNDNTAGAHKFRLKFNNHIIY